MAIEYTWNIHTLDVYPEKNEKTNVVFNVHYSYVAHDTENNIKRSYANSVQIGLPTDTFIEYDNLQKTDVVGWLENLIDTEPIKENLNKQIEETLQPPVLHLKPDWHNQTSE